MKKYGILALYGALAALTILSYGAARDFIIAQEPYDTVIVVSNLTLNYVLFALLVGAFVPSLTRRLLPRVPKWTFIPVAIVVGLLLVVILKVLGVNMRF